MLLSSFFIFIGVLLSQQQDTLFYQIDSLEIIDSKQEVNNIMFSRTYINKSEIIKTNSLDLSDVISKKSGISLRDYGGAGGMKMVSLRGSTANQIAYIYDGFKINDKSSGVFNTALINTNNISNIELQNIGTSSVYGSNSLFGNVIFNSTIPEKKSITFNFGSFNNYNGSITYPINKTTSLSVDYRNNKANYPISVNINNQDLILKRKNSQLNNVNINFTKLFIKNNISQKIRYFLNYTEQGVPGSVIQDKLENNAANLTNNNHYIYYNLDYQNNKILINNGIFYNYSELNYQDSLNKIINSNGINNSYYTNNIQLFSELKYKTNSINYNFRIDNDLIYLNGDNLLNENNILGNLFGVAGNINKQIKIKNKLINLLICLRYDAINYTNNNLSPMFSISYVSNYYNSAITLSRNFRAPSFNEMYYLNFGNSELLPEISNSINFNNKFKITKFIEISINPYYSLVDNYILSMPLSPVVWSASNLEKVNNYGIESQLNVNYNKIKFDFNYTYQKAIFVENTILKNTDLPYIPNEIINSNIYYENNIINTNLLLSYNSFRYFNQGNDANSVIDPFLLIDIIFNKNINLLENNYKLIFSIKNLLNKNYYLVHNFPMPGINFLLTLNYELK